MSCARLIHPGEFRMSSPRGVSRVPLFQINSVEPRVGVSEGRGREEAEQCDRFVDIAAVLFQEEKQGIHHCYHGFRNEVSVGVQRAKLVSACSVVLGIILRHSP